MDEEFICKEVILVTVVYVYDLQRPCADDDLELLCGGVMVDTHPDQGSGPLISPRRPFDSGWSPRAMQTHEGDTTMQIDGEKVER